MLEVVVERHLLHACHLWFRLPTFQVVCPQQESSQTFRRGHFHREIFMGHWAEISPRPWVWGWLLLQALRDITNTITIITQQHWTVIRIFHKSTKRKEFMRTKSYDSQCPYLQGIDLFES